MGIAPIGRQIKIPVICMSRFKDNKTVETSEIIDLYGMLQQLGISLPAL